MADKMNPEIKALWVAALESGEYAQCKGKLTEIAEDGSESHCCLGVLTELAVKAGVSIGRNHIDGGSVFYGTEGEYGESSVTPEDVRAWASLPGYNPFVTYEGDNYHSLAGLNDSEGLTFPEIAAIIREQL